MALIPSNRISLQISIQETRFLFLSRSYAYSKKLGIDERIININRKRAWQIIKEEGRQKEVWLHLLRHSNKKEYPHYIIYIIEDIIVEEEEIKEMRIVL